MGEKSDWVARLKEKFYWSDNEPGPEQVVEEAQKRGIDSIEHLIDRMEDASTLPDNFSERIKEGLPEDEAETVLAELRDGTTTGYMRWKWYRDYRDAFLGNPCDK